MSYVKIFTKMKDNIDRLLDALENPDRYTDAELDKLLSDKEVRETYGMVSKTSDALTPVPNPDIDREWNRFKTEHQEVASARRLYLRPSFIGRNVAAVIVGIVASLAVVAATVGITVTIMSDNRSAHDNTSTDAPAVISAPDVAVTDSVKLSEPLTVVFKDESFETIISTIGRHYGTTATFKSNKSKNLHLYFKWEQNQTLAEVVEELNNFEQIDITLIDNVLTIE